MSSAGRISISSCFQHGLQDGYLSLKPHVKGGLFPLTLARIPCFDTFARTGGGGATHLWRFQTKRRRASRKPVNVLSECSHIQSLLIFQT